MILPVLGFLSFAIALIVKIAIAAAVSYGISLLLAKKQKGPPPAGANEFDLPTAKVGRLVNHVRGKCYVRGSNVLTPIWRYTYEKNSDGSYYYSFNLQIGICRIADGIVQMKAKNKVTWPTQNDYDTEAADGVTSDFVAASSIFGGRAREGGHAGPFNILYGEETQTLDAQLEQYFGSNIPPNRGMVTIIFGSATYSFYWGTQTIVNWPAFLVKSTDLAPDHTAIWQVATANVGSDDDFNPIHAIREWLTDPNVGRGLSTSLIGTSFATAATTCYNEGLGISFNHDNRRDEIQDYIDKVCEIIDGAWYFDRSNGTFEIALARDDYDPDALTTYDEDDFWVTDYTRPSPGKMPSKVVVLVQDRYTESDISCVDDDIALLDAQGEFVNEVELDYRAFVKNETVGNTIAAREQKQFSAMLSTLKIKALRTMADLNKGDVIKITYPDLNIASMIVRVLNVDYGGIEDDRVTIDLIEDFYGSSYTTFGTPSAPASGPTDNAYDTDTYAQAYTSTTQVGPY